MFSTSRDNFESTMQALVTGSQGRIFPREQGPVEILRLELGPRQYIQEDRFHRCLVVHYRASGLKKSMKLWLKFRPDLDILFPMLESYHERLNGAVFPAPYFAWRSQENNMAVLATAYIRGGVLRNKLLAMSLLRQTGRLSPIFASSGAKMRRFHEAFAATETIGIASIIDSAAELVRQTDYLSTVEKDQILAHIAGCAAALPMKSFPAVRNHNDWLLRNILVTPEGTDYVIDCDSMRHRANLRWYDVAHTLLNIESQMKWFPLITAGILSDLWRSFWQGYVRGAEIPDGLTTAQLLAILYVVRVQCLLGGTARLPYFTIMQHGLNRGFLRHLKRSIVAGKPTTLDLAWASTSEQPALAGVGPAVA
jgi:hypothetical protein